MSGRLAPPSVGTVRLVVFTTIVVSLFHFLDNAINVDTYPKTGWQPSWFAVVVAVAWPVYSAFGVAGYLAYRRSDLRKAHVYLVIYGYLVASSLGHFLYGSPSQLTTRGLVSVLVDAVAGAAVIALALWSIAARRERAPRAQRITQ
jgi:hypothetical protein